MVFFFFLMPDRKWVWKRWHWVGIWACWKILCKMGSKHGCVFGYRGALGHVPASWCSWSHCEYFHLPCMKIYWLVSFVNVVTKILLNRAFTNQRNYSISYYHLFNLNYLQINTCNGFYCDQFKPNSNQKPKMWTENWSGW